MNHDALLGSLVAARLLAAGAKFAMAALAVYVVRHLHTTRPRVWWAVVAGEILPGIALVLEAVNSVSPLGDWFYPLLGIHAVAMAGCAVAAWAVVSERVADGLPPVTMGHLSESEQEDAIRRAEDRGAARVYAQALLSRAGPPRPPEA